MVMNPTFCSAANARLPDVVAMRVPVTVTGTANNLAISSFEAVRLAGAGVAVGTGVGVATNCVTSPRVKYFHPNQQVNTNSATINDRVFQSMPSF
jgi:hypothetical protein